MGKTITLDVSASKQTLGDPRFESRCCRPNMVVLAGYGQQEFPFPEVQDIVVNSLSRLEDKSVESDHDKDSGKKFSKLRVKSRGGSKRGADELAGYLTGPAHLIPQTAKSKSANIDGTLFLAAEGLRLMMDDGKYDAIVAERFDDHADKVSWARKTLLLWNPSTCRQWKVLRLIWHNFVNSIWNHCPGYFPYLTRRIQMLPNMCCLMRQSIRSMKNSVRS